MIHATFIILFGLNKNAVATSLDYSASLFQTFERQDVTDSDTFIAFKAPKDKTKLVKKRILDGSKEETSPQSKETQNIRSLEAFDLGSFW